ncbi:response regulator, partial [Acinetobacter baumannii]
RPLHHRAAAASGGARAARGGGLSASFTVFLVDDDVDVREALSFLLRTAGYKVETFPDAASFLRQGRPKHAGCIIMDVRMPGMSGLQ